MWAALEPFLTPILGIALALGTIGLIFGSDKGRKAFTQALTNLMGAFFDVMVPVLTAFESTFFPVARAFVNSLNANGGPLLNIFRDSASLIARNSFTDMETKLKEFGGGNPEDSP